MVIRTYCDRCDTELGKSEIKLLGTDGFFTVEETPYYLLTKGNKEQFYFCRDCKKSFSLWVKQRGTK